MCLTEFDEVGQSLPEVQPSSQPVLQSRNIALPVLLRCGRFLSILSRRSILALSASSFTSAQDKASNDLNTLLRDASYVFNRFEEVSAGVRMQIEVHYPVQLREGTKEALSGTLKSMAKEKPALNAIIDHAKVSSADLLDVYTEIMEVASLHPSWRRRRRTTIIGVMKNSP